MWGRNPRRCFGVGATLVCFVFAPFAFAAVAQAAGEYDVQVCTPSGSARGHGLQMVEGASQGPPLNFSKLECEPVNGEPTIAITADPGLLVGFAEWVVMAPPGVLIQSVTGNRKVRLVHPDHINKGIRWAARPDDPKAQFEGFPLVGGSLPSGSFTWTPTSPTPAVHGRVFCEFEQCSNLEHEEEQEEEISFTNVVAHMVDESPPTVTTGGSLLAAGPVSGERELSFDASDAGGGIVKVSLAIDGVTKESKVDSNQGLCAKPYRAVQPCVTELDSSFSLDTRSLTDGTHKVEVLVEDAGTQVTASAAQINVHNRPLNTGHPSLSGEARAGQTLAVSTGQWEGGPVSFAYQWLRCPASVKPGEEASCVPVSGAEREIYEAQEADAGKRLVARVVATNAAGSEATFSAASAPVAAASGSGNGPGGGGGGGAGAPQTKIVKHPRARAAVVRARFVFSSDQAGSSFQCKLDRARFKPCRSPFKHKVKPGRHSFQVRAVSPAGVADPSPAKFRWKVTK